MTENSAIFDPRWLLDQPRLLRKTTATPRGTPGLVKSERLRHTFSQANGHPANIG
jgi:hypothetical protein